MTKCTCLLKHTNGGICNCLDNWEEDYEDGDVEVFEEKEDLELDSPDNKKRNLYKDDDIVH